MRRLLVTLCATAVLAARPSEAQTAAAVERALLPLKPGVLFQLSKMPLPLAELTKIFFVPVGGAASAGPAPVSRHMIAVPSGQLHPNCVAFVHK